MSHNHEQEHAEHRLVLKRIIAAIIFFAGGFFYAPLFIVSYLVAGLNILLSAIKNIFRKQFFDENFLMSLATLGALAIGEYPEAVMVMVLYQIGEFLQHLAVHESKESIEELMDIRPDYAILNGEKVSPDTIKIDDIITVNPGEKIPLDGIIAEGNASIDTSALTGESIPIDVQKNSQVISGSINLNGVLKIKVTKLYKESTVNKILELIEEASEKKAKTENFITKFASVYTPVVVILALLIAFVLPIFLPAENWFERALTFLVISCPCALVISVPLTFFAGIGGASANGILIKGGNYLEQLSKTEVVVFDKTGTLTKGTFRVKEINSENKNILKYAAIAEFASSHPIAAAIRRAYKEELPEVTDIHEYSGQGILAEYQGETIKAGKAEFIGVEPIETTGSVIYISVNNNYIGNIVVSDSLKEDAKDLVYDLKSKGIKTVMLTGDTFQRALNLKKEVPLDEFYANLMPSDKVKKVEELLSKGTKTLAFVGDGINDAPVLARADIGIAMGSLGSDAAIEAADVVIMDDKLSKVSSAICISKKTMLIVKQNIAFAIFIKVLFLILGSFGYMTMWGAVFADVGVTMIATLNSLRASK